MHKTMLAALSMIILFSVAATGEYTATRPAESLARRVDAPMQAWGQETIGLESDAAPAPAYPYGNPAGCAAATATASTPEEMLANVRAALGGEYNLDERRAYSIWNGELQQTVNVRQERYAYEFIFNEFQHPLTYRGDRVATIFLTQGFAVWFRAYGGNFRLLAVPLAPGVFESDWAGYARAYWQKDGTPGDATIYPVIKKLPCHWMIEQGYTSREAVAAMFDLDWQAPDFLAAGRQYLAADCAEANRVAKEEIGYPSASSMCGPLAWTILRDANGFPYRIGSWSASARAFTGANPRWNGQPWGTFDPDTYTLIRTDAAMPGYDFAAYGNLYPGDVIYSFATLYEIPDDGLYDHIFMVTGIDANQTRFTISNMIKNSTNCSISEVALYTPGDRKSGVINTEWNGGGYGKTGTTGFDIMRWDWVTYHINGLPQDYTVRWGDTVETIAFDWKISPASLLAANPMTGGTTLTPGQVIHLPVPQPVTASQPAAGN